MSDKLSDFVPSAVVEIYTDGACSGNPGPGGWGALLRQNTVEVELSGGDQQTTNNRMEMMAAIGGISALPPKFTIQLFTDSQYLKDGITSWIKNWKKNGWKTAAKNPVKNQDLWQRLDDLMQTHTIEWNWVRGHNGHPENERADMLARKAIIAQRMAD
ncbi:MAG: ribonuclease HI [Alphaproteobacteria bacterium]|nr:ribonuclease HI [Alphaproteobacteria bacterium]